MTESASVLPLRTVEIRLPFTKLPRLMTGGPGTPKAPSCMCALVMGPLKFCTVTSTHMESRVAFNAKLDTPTAGVDTGGVSSAPVSLAENKRFAEKLSESAAMSFTAQIITAHKKVNFFMGIFLKG